ncbi:unnamed protein product [Brassica oleracea var. botrytis]
MSRSEREEYSDCDEEMEVDIHTSMSDDGVRDQESNGMRADNAHQSRNVRTRIDGPNLGCMDRTLIPYRTSFFFGGAKKMIEPLIILEGAIVMKGRYVGHCNVGTDIKQASFLGQRGVS